VGAAGRVVAFEPVLSTAGCVARTRELNGLRQLMIVPMGLASNASLETRRLPTVRGMADSTVSPGGWEEQISVASFDTIWNLLCEENPAVHGVKIDVQGMELEVIEGMRHTLRAQHPKLIVEFHRGVDRSQALALLGDCGYSAPGAPIEFDRSSPPYQDDKSYLFLNQCAAL
jgi:FkbM family methyltransferase